VAKFHNDDYLDYGVTHRRHIVAAAVEHMGKEANRWEEQYYLGLDLETHTVYGTSLKTTHTNHRGSSLGEQEARQAETGDVGRRLVQRSVGGTARQAATQPHDPGEVVSGGASNGERS
jgi:hypothetical protein